VSVEEHWQATIAVPSEGNHLWSLRRSGDEWLVLLDGSYYMKLVEMPYRAEGITGFFIKGKSAPPITELRLWDEAHSIANLDKLYRTELLEPGVVNSSILSAFGSVEASEGGEILIQREMAWHRISAAVGVDYYPDLLARPVRPTASDGVFLPRISFDNRNLPFVTWSARSDIEDTFFSSSYHGTGEAALRLSAQVGDEFLPLGWYEPYSPTSIAGHYDQAGRLAYGSVDQPVVTSSAKGSYTFDFEEPGVLLAASATSGGKLMLSKEESDDSRWTIRTRDADTDAGGIAWSYTFWGESRSKLPLHGFCQPQGDENWARTGVGEYVYQPLVPDASTLVALPVSSEGNDTWVVLTQVNDDEALKVIACDTETGESVDAAFSWALLSSSENRASTFIEQRLPHVCDLPGEWDFDLNFGWIFAPTETSGWIWSHEADDWWFISAASSESGVWWYSNRDQSWWWSHWTLEPYAWSAGRNQWVLREKVSGV
jgi:hypothetical protein